MKTAPKTGVAHLQQTKSLNSRVITLLHALVADIKYDGGSFPPDTPANHREVRDLTRVIKKLANEQREVKTEIRASRTSTKVYKKHPKTRSQARGGIIMPAGVLVGALPVAAQQAT